MQREKSELVYLSGPDNDGQWRAEISNPNHSEELLRNMGFTALDAELIGHKAFMIDEGAFQQLRGVGVKIIEIESSAA